MTHLQRIKRVLRRSNMSVRKRVGKVFRPSTVDDIKTASDEKQESKDL